jgi:hypothetical protein
MTYGRETRDTKKAVRERVKSSKKHLVPIPPHSLNLIHTNIFGSLFIVIISLNTYIFCPVILCINPNKLLSQPESELRKQSGNIHSRLLKMASFGVQKAASWMGEQ